MISIIVFPGSNCDRDLKVAIEKVLKKKVNMIWHKTSHIKKSKIIFIPGGFSFGDHLRAGILATKSPAMKEVNRLSKKGIPIIGICNGFQILTECNMLPGILIKNKNPKFICKNTYLAVNKNSNFTKKYKKNQIISLPIAHSQGNYFASKSILNSLEDNNQIIFKYSNQYGKTNIDQNPNGSKNNIAGIINTSRNVLGLMPHPERAIGLSKKSDGKNFFRSLETFL
tara:strand:+ start:355 stop:1032 length:678 start_codon:yes stop_codon:yes gene_type:complete